MFESLAGRRKPRLDVGRVIEAAQQKIKETKAEIGEERIVEPFEAAVDKSALSFDILRQWGKLPIEVFLRHLRDGRAVVSTGRKALSQYDFGEEQAEPRRESHFGKMMRRLRQTSSENAIEDAKRTTIEREYDYKQPYCLHNHPGSSLPSGGDLSISANNKSDVDIVLRNDMLIFYKARNKLVYPDTYQSMGELRAIELLGEWGIDFYIIPLDEADARSKIALAFLQGQMPWDRAKRLLDRNPTRYDRYSEFFRKRRERRN